MPKFFAAAFLVCGLFFLASTPSQAETRQQALKAHKIEIRQENENFNRTMREGSFTAEERRSAVAQHRNAMYQRNKTFYDGLHKEDMAALKARLDLDPRLTDDQKKKNLENTEKLYKDLSAFRDKQNSKGVFVSF